MSKADGMPYLDSIRQVQQLIRRNLVARNDTGSNMGTRYASRNNYFQKFKTTYGAESKAPFPKVNLESRPVGFGMNSSSLIFTNRIDSEIIKPILEQDRSEKTQNKNLRDKIRLKSHNYFDSCRK